MVRPAARGELERGGAAELDVVQVATPDEVPSSRLPSARGFGGEDATVDTTFHPPAILGDARMRMLTGVWKGTPLPRR